MQPCACACACRCVLCMYIYIYVNVCVYICQCMCMCMCMCMCVCMCANECMHVYVYQCMHLLMYGYACMHVRACVRVCISVASVHPRPDVITKIISKGGGGSEVYDRHALQPTCKFGPFLPRKLSPNGSSCSYGFWGGGSFFSVGSTSTGSPKGSDPAAVAALPGTTAAARAPPATILRRLRLL